MKFPTAGACRLALTRTCAGAVAVVLVIGCAGGGSSGRAQSTRHGVRATIDVTAGPTSVASAGAATALPDQVRDQVVATVRRYIDVASVRPLQTGQPAGDLAPMFAPPAVARAQGADRAVLVDEGLSKVTADVAAKAQPLTQTALADPSGTIVLVDASLSLTVDSKTAQGPVEIRREGDIVLAPQDGAWKVLGFDLRVARTGKGLADVGGKQ